MLTIPTDVEAYRTIGPFDQESVPKGLLRDHITKAGVWELLEVDAGTVRYVVTEPGHESKYVLDENHRAVITPLHRHRLQSIDDVRFRFSFQHAKKQ